VGVSFFEHQNFDSRAKKRDKADVYADVDEGAVVVFCFSSLSEENEQRRSPFAFYRSDSHKRASSRTLLSLSCWSNLNSAAFDTGEASPFLDDAVDDDECRLRRRRRRKKKTHLFGRPSSLGALSRRSRYFPEGIKSAKVSFRR